MPDHALAADAVDLFAGPGGWDLPAAALGIDVVGVELDDAACATRAAAGLRTVQADVAALDPVDFGKPGGLIGSPPCPTFSRAGRGAGAHLTDVIVECMRALADGRDERQAARDEAFRTLQPVAWANEQVRARKASREPDRAKADEQARRDADMTLLVVEPLRWALALEPTWIALEQVPDVLPLWRVVAELLERQGYRTWCGVLEAERYGVPQTRERAVLVARRDGRPAHPPVATHQRYDPRVPRLDGPELTLEGEVLPWVSMADALAWGLSELVGFPRRDDGADAVELDGVEYRERDLRSADQPAQVLTDKARSWLRWQFRAGAQANQSVRGLDEPAPMIVGGHDWNRRRWEATETDQSAWTDRPASTVVGGRRSGDGMLIGRQLPPGEDRSVGGWSDVPEDDPRRRQDGGDRLGLKGEDWPDRRPATTLAGDPRVFQPGGHHEQGEQSRFAVRVTEQEAGVLQTFPADYPWQGSRSKRYQQIGNAVPPLLALRVLEAVVR